MLGTIGAICLKYWVEVLLGLVAAGLGFLFKRYLQLERKEYYTKLTTDIKNENKAIIELLTTKYVEIDKKVEEEYEQVLHDVDDIIEKEHKESKADDALLQNEIDDLMGQMSCLKAGLLSMQGKEFRNNCRDLLNEDHTITLDEWEEIDADHEAYNGLGGNHKGDHLYGLVKTKFEKGL